MTLLPYEAEFPVLGTRARVFTSRPETLLPAVEFVRSELDAFDLSGTPRPILTDYVVTVLQDASPLSTAPLDAEHAARTLTAQRVADLLADELDGGFLVDLGGAAAVAGESLGATAPEFAVA